jgi:Subtilase family
MFDNVGLTEKGSNWSTVKSFLVHTFHDACRPKMVTMLQLLTTLSTILINASTIAGLHRGHPVPPSLIKEARALNARYKHICTHRDTYRRIHRERQGQERHRGLQDESYSLMLLEEHLFKPIQPRADNEQIDQNAGTRVLRQVALEGSAQPVFFCSHCSGVDQHAQEECARCKGVIRQQQETIQNAVVNKFPNARIVATTAKLANMVFVEMTVAPQDDISEIDHALSQIPGVLKILPQEDSTLDDAEAAGYIGGGKPLVDRFCGAGGKGVIVAILDSGVDYTHERIGGPGTTEAYRLAYGTGASSDENKQVNPSVFPTDTVVGGRDFLGESFVHTAESLDTDAIPDDNPIDANRHGTMVADAILSVAPQAKLLAYKVCTSDTGTCPGFAVLQALEYALDPNKDGNTDDKVDIVNLSLGGSYLSSYYDLRTAALEKVGDGGMYSAGAVLAVVARWSHLYFTKRPMSPYERSLGFPAW